MNEHVDPSVKKRSLSNYLSNVNLRREELEKLKKKQDEEKQQLALQQEQLKQEEQVKEKERLITEQHELEALRRKEDQQKKTVPTEHEERKETDIPQQFVVEDNNSNLRSLDPNGEEWRRPIPGDKVEDAVNTINDHISPQPDISYNAKKGIEDPKSETISRDDLHAMLKEPKVRRRHGVAADNCEDEVTMDKETKKEDLSEEEIASDAPTEPASPPKPRRRRLIRGDRLSSLSPRHSTFDNDSDSELSDIDELKSVQISSSFIHGDSSPVRDSHDSRHRYHQPSSPRLVRRSRSPGRAKHHIAVSKASKQKKGIYRDAGGRTRLQISCDKGNYEQAKKLIEEEGYDVNDQDNAGNTALHEAALNGHLETVKLLIRNGADVNMQSFEMFKDTPLIDASANGHLDVVKYLLSHGADPTICNAKGLTAFESIEDSDLDEQERDIVHEIKRNLRSAARNWKDDAVSGVLIRKDKHPKSQSQLSQRSEELLGDFEFFWTDITSRAGKEKLFKASKEGKLSYVGAYLENGGKIDLKSFFEAVKFGHEDIVSLFLAFGAPVNAVSKSGTTALICAVGRGHVGTVKLLLEAGADPSKRDRNDHTASHYAKNSPMGVVNSEEISLLEQALGKSGSHVIPKGKGIKKSHEQAHVEEENIIKRQEDITEDHNNQEDDENVISIARKRRTVSPDRLETKRQALSSETLSPEEIQPKELVSPENIGPSKTSEKSTPELESAKIPEQTPEEKEQRLKAEEEYIHRRLQNKRRKEQELLRKLALDEEKREKERAQQKVEEAKKLQERERLRQIELENKNKEAELVRRREIRSLYPIGLRLVDFNNADDYHNYLPLYFAEVGKDASKYVLDLQLCVILKDTNLLSNEQNIQNKIPVQLKHKRQLWNIMKFIFLNGGKDAFNWNFCSLQARIQFELQEYTKFSNLPLQWIKLQDICISDISKRQQIEQDIVQIVLNDNIDETEDIPTARELPIESVRPNMLPNKFQKRHTITHILQNYKTQPLW